MRRKLWLTCALLLAAKLSTQADEREQSGIHTSLGHQLSRSESEAVIGKEDDRFQSLQKKLHTESEKLRKVLLGAFSIEEKRRAIEAFQTHREIIMAEKLAEIKEPTVLEKAIMRRQQKELAEQLSAEQREIMAARIAMNEEMDRFRSEGKGLTYEQRREQIERIRAQHYKIQERQLFMAKEAEKKGRDEPVKRFQSPFIQAMNVEKQKLAAAMRSHDPAQRYEATEKFRTEMNQLKEERIRNLERMLNQGAFEQE